MQRGFPALAFYEPERIVFSIPLNDHMSGWGTVMDEAWAQFGNQPPTRLRVEVEDAPGDYSRREYWFCTVRIELLLTHRET